MYVVCLLGMGVRGALDSSELEVLAILIRGGGGQTVLKGRWALIVLPCLEQECKKDIET